MIGIIWELNVSKTKEMVIDFRKTTRGSEPITIKGIEVERVSVYKYLAVMIDDRLAWGDEIDHTVKRSNLRM